MQVDSSVAFSALYAMHGIFPIIFRGILVDGCKTEQDRMRSSCLCCHDPIRASPDLVGG